MGRTRHTPKPKMGEVTRSESGDTDIEWVSKSEMKREAARLEALANRLVAASNEQLAELALPAEVQAALKEARRLTHRDARQRQIRHVSRLLQDIDTAPVQAMLDLYDPGSETGQQIHRLTEQWRDRLTQDPDAVTDCIDQFPGIDHQSLRQAVRNARKAAEQVEKKPDADRERTAHRRVQQRLYQLLRPFVLDAVRKTRKTD